MKRAELLQQLRSSRDGLEALLEGLPDGARETPGAAGEWSVKDLLAHLAAWEAELVTAMAKLKQGTRSIYFDMSDEKVDEQNARIYADNRDRSWDRVMHDFNAVRPQVIRQTESFSQAELEAVVSKKPGKRLMDYILGETAEHLDDHLPELRAWVEKWK